MRSIESQPSLTIITAALVKLSKIAVVTSTTYRLNFWYYRKRIYTNTRHLAAGYPKTGE